MRLLYVWVGNLHLLHIVRVVWERIVTLIDRLLHWHALISLLTLAIITCLIIHPHLLIHNLIVAGNRWFSPTSLNHLIMASSSSITLAKASSLVVTLIHMIETSVVKVISLHFILIY